MNPWLKIPAEEYEAHMSDPGVDQSRFLEKMFCRAMEKYDVRTMALLGCATGNGLNHVDPEKTHTITAVDINAHYLKILERRFSTKIKGLSIVRADLETVDLKKETYSLIFAGLIFEYINPGSVLKKIAQWLNTSGTLVVVLQMADPENQTVSASPYQSLKLLKPLIKLVRPDAFDRLCQLAKLKKIEHEIITLKSNKSFYVAAYKKTRGID